MAVSTRTHVKVGFANPYLKCEDCGDSVPYWHDQSKCGCDVSTAWNYPCMHETSVHSSCDSWSPVDGCTCEVKCTK